MRATDGTPITIGRLDLTYAPVDRFFMWFPPPNGSGTIEVTPTRTRAIAIGAESPEVWSGTARQGGTPLTFSDSDDDTAATLGDVAAAAKNEVVVMDPAGSTGVVIAWD